MSPIAVFEILQETVLTHVFVQVTEVLGDHQVFDGNQSVFVDFRFHIVSPPDLLTVAFEIFMIDRIGVYLYVVLKEHPEGFEDSSVQALVVLFLENIRKVVQTHHQSDGVADVSAQIGG